MIDLYMDLLEKWVWRKMAAIKSGDKEAVKEAQEIEEAIAKKIGLINVNYFFSSTTIIFPVSPPLRIA